MSSLFEQAGIASFLPGMRFSIEVLVREVVSMQQRAGLPAGDVREMTSAIFTILTGTDTYTIEPKKVIRAEKAQQGSVDFNSVPTPALSVHQAMWTPEMREKASKRLKAARAAGIVVPPNERVQPKPAGLVKGRSLAERAEDGVRTVGGALTVYGLAHEAGVTVYRMRSAIERTGMKGRKVPHPKNRGVKITIYPVAALNRVLRQLKATDGKGQVLPNHPRNAGHPKHDEWRKTMSEAQNRRVANQKKLPAPDSQLKAATAPGASYVNGGAAA